MLAQCGHQCFGRYHDKFNPKRRVEADTLVAQLKNPAAQTEGLTHNELQLVLQYGRQEGYFKDKDPTNWSPEDGLRMEAITGDIQRQRAQWIQSHPKQKPGAEEVQKWVHGWYQPNTVLGNWRDKTITKAEAVLTPEKYRNETIIPSSDLKQIDDALSKLRLSTDNVNRMWMYRQLHAKRAGPTVDADADYDTSGRD